MNLTVDNANRGITVFLTLVFGAHIWDGDQQEAREKNASFLSGKREKMQKYDFSEKNRRHQIDSNIRGKLPVAKPKKTAPNR